MNIVILGAGKLGMAICAQLAEEGHSVTVIDKNQEISDRASDDFDVMNVCGDGMDIDTLMEAGINKTDIFIATMADDEINMVSALFAKKLGAKHVVARVRNPLYSHQTAFMREEMGISMMVNPEYESAVEISRLLKFPQATHVETFAKGRVEMAEVKVAHASPLADKALYEIGKKINAKALVCAVGRGEEVYVPNGEFVIREGDRINVTASHTVLSEFLDEAGIITNKIRSVMIIGCGAVGFYLARLLLESGLKVKVIDRDRANLEKVASMLPKAELIVADGTNHQVLIEEGIMSTDALVSLTGVDEENIIVSLFAKANGVDKVIAKVNNTTLKPIVRSLGLDSIVTPKDVATNIISTYVRAKKNAKDSGVMTLYKLGGGRIEAIEFRAGESGDYLGKKLKDLNLRKNVLVAAIVKGNKTIVPNGDSTIDTGDRVMVVSQNTHYDDLSELFD
ncbi:MAG: Trk system potassium transporter TrkA [Clostridia bacterium]|nr:Trk system potassium transporter TrkA [Clostridia bacterium]